MSDNQTNWIFNLIDGVTKPLKSIQGVVIKSDNLFKKTTSDTQKEIDGLTSHIKILETQLARTHDLIERDRLSKEIQNAKIKVSELVQSMNKLETETSTTVNLFDKLGTSAFKFNAITQNLQGLSDGIINLSAESESFEFSMRKMNTMAGLSEAEFGKMNEQVKNIANDIPIARDALGEGLYEVISNGVPKNNWLDFLEKSSKTSVGGIADLGKVVGVTTTFIKNYGLAWDDAGMIQDKIQKTAVLGKTNFEEMGAALPSIAGPAALLKVDIDQLLGSMATLTGVTGNTSEVATQLQGVFSALIGPTSQATEQAEKLGIAFDAKSISKSGGMINFLDELKKKVDAYSISTGESSETIYATLFGSTEARKAILSLTGNLSADFKIKSEDIANSTGTIEKAYSQMADTSINKTIGLKNWFAGLKDSLFEVTGAWMPLLKVGSENMVMFSQMLPGLKLAGTGFKKLSDLSGLTKGLNMVTSAFKGLNLVMKASVIGAVVAAIAAITAAVVYFRKESDTASKAQKRFNDMLIEGESALRGDFEALKQTKEGTNERKKAIDEINAAYGQYLPNLLTEKSTLEEIESAQISATNALRQDILLKAKKQEINEAISSSLEIQKKGVTKLNKIFSELGIANDEYTSMVIENFKIASRHISETDFRGRYLIAKTSIESLEKHFKKQGISSLDGYEAFEKIFEGEKGIQYKIQGIEDMYSMMGINSGGNSKVNASPIITNPDVTGNGNATRNNNSLSGGFSGGGSGAGRSITMNLHITNVFQNEQIDNMKLKIKKAVEEIFVDAARDAAILAGQ